MKLTKLVLLSLFILLGCVVPKLALAQAGCNVGSWQGYPGGYYVKKQCATGSVGGVGITISDAYANADKFAALANNKNTYCDTNTAVNGDIGVVPGAFIFKFHCHQSGAVFEANGFGTNATDAGSVAHSFAELGAGLVKVRCTTSTSNVSVAPGAYFINYYCINNNGQTGTVTGIGESGAVAGLNAYLFASALRGGTACESNTSMMSAYVGGFVINFNCRGIYGMVTVSGMGSTSGDAALLAAEFAGLAYAPLDRAICITTNNSVALVSGQWKVDYNCAASSGGGLVTGVGYSPTAAGRDAFQKADARWGKDFPGIPL